MFDCPLKSKEEDRFLVPEWAKGKVVYQIFPDRFAASHEVDEKLWYDAPVKNWRALYGGNLKGITDKLEYLKDLGVDIVYMTPIFLSGSNHKYDTTDYYTIDRTLGPKRTCRNWWKKLTHLECMWFWMVYLIIQARTFLLSRI